MTADTHGQVGGNWGPARALLPPAAEPNPAAADPGDDQAWTPAPPALLYPNVVAWVHGWLIHIYRRPVGDGRNLAWCPQWWRHPKRSTASPHYGEVSNSVASSPATPCPPGSATTSTTTCGS